VNFRALLKSIIGSFQSIHDSSLSIRRKPITGKSVEYQVVLISGSTNIR